jgi:SAM-dependent methyltransferase
MNATDDSPESDDDKRQGRRVNSMPPGVLAERIAEVLSVLAAAQAEAERAGPGAAPRLLVAYRERFRIAMQAFGDALADALEATPGVFAPDSPDNPLTPLLERTRDLPLFRRAQQSIKNDEDDHDLHRVLVVGRGAGFDLPSLLLEDYYQDTVLVRTFRRRVASMGEMLRDEVCRRVAEGQKEVRLLNLRCGGLLELEPLLEHSVCAAHSAITCVDDSTTALRLARQSVARRLALQPRFVRADPLTLGENPNRPREPFDFVLTFSLFDLLPPTTALRLARNCSGLLKPDGALITTGYLPSVPRGEKALALGLLGARVNFWDEPSWRNLLRRASFDSVATRFERRSPAAIALSAPRLNSDLQM